MGHKSSWGVDNRGDNAVSEVLLYKDGTSQVHGVLADGTKIAYELAPGRGGDKFVGRLLSDGYWVKARTADAPPEYILCRGEGYKLMVTFQCTDSGGLRCRHVFACVVCARWRASARDTDTSMHRCLYAQMPLCTCNSTVIHPRRHMLYICVRMRLFNTYACVCACSRFQHAETYSVLLLHPQTRYRGERSGK